MQGKELGLEGGASEEVRKELEESWTGLEEERDKRERRRSRITRRRRKSRSKKRKENTGRLWT